MFFAFVLLNIFWLAQSNDCGQLCVCLEEYVFCQSVYKEPELQVQSPDTVIGVYINNGYLPSLGFLKAFTNLQFLELTDVSVNCSLLTGVAYRITDTDCPGM